MGSPMPRAGGCGLACGRQAGNQRPPFPKRLRIGAGMPGRIVKESGGMVSGMTEKRSGNDTGKGVEGERRKISIRFFNDREVRAVWDESADKW